MSDLPQNELYECLEWADLEENAKQSLVNSNMVFPDNFASKPLEHDI